jgi:hypothetical protein
MSWVSSLYARIEELAAAIGDGLQLRGFLTGGDAGQVQRKASGDDFDMEWADLTTELSGEDDPNYVVLTLGGAGALFAEGVPVEGDLLYAGVSDGYNIWSTDGEQTALLTGEWIALYLRTEDAMLLRLVDTVAAGDFFSASPPTTPVGDFNWSPGDGSSGDPTITAEAVTATPGIIYNQIVAGALVAKWVNISPGLWKRIRFIEDEPS